MGRLHDELKALGKISLAEIRAAVTFVLVLLWATDRYHGIRAEVVAGACVVLMPSVCRLLSPVFALTTLISESKTARTLIMFLIIITIAKRFGWESGGVLPADGVFDQPGVRAVFQIETSQYQLSARPLFIGRVV